MSKPKQRLLTGLQPSGDLHIGNYFGALKPFLDTYRQYESFLMVADYHALTSVKDAATLRSNTLNIVRDYLAVELDPTAVTIFKQSDNPDHFELTWIFNCLVTVPFLELGHAYKDKIGKGIEPSVGLFTYPMLQAADIALYHTDIVPVGEDQRQHLEYTREAVGKFNRTYGEVFREPKTMILEGVGVVPGTDGKKMSKSYKNTIPLFASKDEIVAAVMKIVTDSTGDRPEHVYAIHRLFKSTAELEPVYEAHQGRYGDLKKLLIEDIDAFISPLRARRAEISDEEVHRVLAEGALRARAVSYPILKQARAAVGIL